ncbi:MAG TPA: cytochrome c [Terriglobales bacterium]|jgi:mono/diheme cytochrome c family protein|nr:cytochrome c [Terriglobales bacterium]
MRSFCLGVIITLLVLVLGGLACAFLGFMPTNADATPPALERRIAAPALDASMERHAPRVNSPLPPTDDNLIDGIKIYTMNCALCHGGLDNKPSALEHSFYPPPPQLILDPLDDPEWHIFYAVRTGVRYTGMPAWGRTLSEQDMWKVTAFLSRIEKLPPGVQDYWKKSFGTAPPTEGAGHDMGHMD